MQSTIISLALAIFTVCHAIISASSGLMNNVYKPIHEYKG